VIAGILSTSRGRFSALALAGLVVFVALACGEDDEVAPAAAGKIDASSDGTGTGPREDSALPDQDARASAGTGLSPTFVHRDINHILSTGQSLSVGAVGSPPLSTTQPYANVMFAQGVIPGGTALTSFAPLREGMVEGSATPDVETMSASLANLVARMAREELLASQPPGKTSHDVLVSAHGVGGIAYVGLKKGTVPYANGMAQAKAGLEVAKASGRSYVVRAVTNVHGESDHVNSNASYAQDLAQWQKDYETDVRAITGQTDPIPMLHTQMSSWTRYSNATTSFIPQAQLAASIASGGKIVLVGPKYHLSYVADGVHLTNEGYRHMGEDYAKVYRRVILEGRPWEPLRPIAVTRAGAVITVKLVVPAPPLVLDTATIEDPGNFGFEFAETGANPTIKTVAVTAPDTVTITLSAEPTGTNKRIRYAFTGVGGALAGPKTGARGNLRDSDMTPSRNGYPLRNWCVHFNEAVP
jgi:hypothetical protein